MKSLVRRALVGCGAASLARMWGRGTGVILAYHNVIPSGEPAAGETPLHIKKNLFARHLDVLARTHEIVGLEELFDVSPESKGHPRAAITFDDGYAGALTIGVEELVSRNLPATFFVAPGLIGRSDSFWWDLLANSRTGRLNADVRRLALEVHGGDQERILGWARDSGITFNQIPWYARSATVSQLREATARNGIELASHTWSHLDLPRQEEGSLQDEFVQPQRWFRDHSLPSIPWLAYPYGSTSETVAQRASIHYEGGVTISRQVIRLSDHRLGRYRLPRVNISAGISPAHFELLAAGFGMSRYP